MKRYTVSTARSHLAEVLDRAERGEAVYVIRHDQAFAITVDRSLGRGAASAPFVEVDDALMGGWTWEWRPSGKMSLRVRKRRRRRR